MAVVVTRDFGDSTAMKPIVVVLFLVGAGCGPSGRHGDDFGSGDAKNYMDAPCSTAITGKVFAPNGTLPLYNVSVYAPVDNPVAFTPGVQCGQCSTELPGGSYATTTSDAEGKFRLDGIPAGVNVPVIITTGKWRRRLTVPVVVACSDTAIPDGTFRLPKNRNEGEMPRIAVVTGGCDPLACILTKLGVDTAEFGSSSAGPTAVVFYNGAGGTAPGTPAASTALWGNLDELKKFDVVINSCECDEHNENKTSPDLLKQYADLGGRVFGSHYHYTWMKNLVPSWQGTAVWNSGSSSTPDLVDTSHTGGMALAQWLKAVGASTTLGQITLGTKTLNASTVTPPTTRWLYASGAAPATTHYLSFQTPVGVPEANQCGKVVYAGMHVSSGDVGTSFPSACSTTFTPDEKALVFLLFDLTTCVGSIF
jgi:hypothetical protein